MRASKARAKALAQPSSARVGVGLNVVELQSCEALPVTQDGFALTNEIEGCEDVVSQVGLHLPAQADALATCSQKRKHGIVVDIHAQHSEVSGTFAARIILLAILSGLSVEMATDFGGKVDVLQCECDA